MKSIKLRTLLRELLKVKRWTSAGECVRITDKGKPLWILRSANSTHDEKEHVRAIDRILDKVLREPKSHISLSQIVKESRR